MKNSNDTIGNQSRDLLTFSSMPQPAARKSSIEFAWVCKRVNNIIRPFLGEKHVNVFWSILAKVAGYFTTQFWIFGPKRTALHGISYVEIFLMFAPQEHLRNIYSPCF
jgi:hypothetical protein